MVHHTGAQTVTASTMLGDISNPIVACTTLECVAKTSISREVNSEPVLSFVGWHKSNLIEYF